MSLLGDISKEGVIESVVKAVKKELEVTREPNALESLKRIGRTAMNELEFTSPEWAGEYHELFKES